MSELICFYHGVDLDGHASGAIVKKRYPEAVLIPIAHEGKFPFELIDGKDLIMVDFSLALEDMIEANDRAASFVWIDHHKTAIDALDHLALPGVRDNNLAACEIAWAYFFPDSMVPQAVHLLGRWDVWDHSDPEVRPFQFGMRSYETDPRAPLPERLWLDLLADDPWMVDRVLTAGDSVVRYAEREMADYAARFTYQTELAGIPALAINRGRGGSDLFASVRDDKRAPLLIAYGRLPEGAWLVSLYTFDKDLDVGELARQFGGGGHKGAAGFVWRENELPFIDQYFDREAIIYGGDE